MSVPVCFAQATGVDTVAACYVPASGTMYRVRVAGVPAACVSPTHTAFQFVSARDGAVGATGPAGSQGVAGAPGAQGATGVAGPQGPPGSNAASGIEVVINTTTAPANSGLTTFAQCPSGKIAIAGGHGRIPPTVQVRESRPGQLSGQIPGPFDRGLWTIGIRNDTASSFVFDVYAVCVNPG